MNVSKFKILVSEHWIPSLITGVFGIVVGLSVSFFNAEISENRYFLEKQSSTADLVAEHFSKYTENWKRIIHLKTYVQFQQRKPTEQEKELLKRYVLARDSAKDSLFIALDSLHLYFKKETSDLSLQFRDWDEQQSRKKIQNLPPIKDWQLKGHEILLSMRRELLNE